MSMFRYHEDTENNRNLRFYLRGMYNQADPYEGFVNINRLFAYHNYGTGRFFVRGRPQFEDIVTYRKVQALFKCFATEVMGFNKSSDSWYVNEASIQEYQMQAGLTNIIYRKRKGNDFVNFNIGDYFALCVWREQDEMSGYPISIFEWSDVYYIQAIRFTKVLATPTYDPRLKAWKTTIDTRDLYHDHSKL